MLPQPTHHQNNFLNYLQAELSRRCEKNPRYSLRSFAASLNIGSSDLSKLLNGKRALTSTTLVKMAKKLDLDPVTVAAFQAQLRFVSNVSTKAGDESVNYRQIDLDSFHFVADWYHLAILELMKVKGFKPLPNHIARRLGLTTSEVNFALQRLQRLGFLEINADGKWSDQVGATTSATSSYTDVAKKRLQRQILQKAMDALDSTPMERRDQSAMLMAVNSKNLPAAQTLIRDFRRQLCALLEDGVEKDQIYYLSVSLFPILNEISLVEQLS